ncbi:response regulator transcription factor [Serratia ureilytica]|uniref:response regulator transcription factor n=1 Tax=Serratia ureilytica TaxID=300181 RepID=UPI0018E713D2|nr:LuxR C-terminal-related transcriptional regulator [Serratia ureilytica]MBJ2099147.1 response regulator transcription factor [Serratia ureilytica]
MKNNYSISIYDEDQYFILGLKCLLLGYLSRYNILEHNDDKQTGEGKHIELVFSSSSGKYRHHHYHLDSNANSTVKIFFYISSPGRSRGMRGGCGWQYAGVLPRYASHAVFEKMLSGALTERSLAKRPERCPSCAEKYLSSREKQVMHYLRQGLSQAQVAALMQLSVKTIHSHKSSLMQKMTLKNKHDFIYWLIQ